MHINVRLVHMVVFITLYLYRSLVQTCTSSTCIYIYIFIYLFVGPLWATELACWTPCATLHHTSTYRRIITMPPHISIDKPREINRYSDISNYRLGAEAETHIVDFVSRVGGSASHINIYIHINACMRACFGKYFLRKFESVVFLAFHLTLFLASTN